MDAWDVSPSLPVPLDILLDIVALLPLHTVLALRRTCRSLCAVTRLRSLWTLLFRRHVLEQRIPHPHLGGTPLADLSADALESLTRRALTLRRSWTSPEPVPRRRLTLDTPAEPSARIIFLQFLPGRSNRWLVSVRMTARPRTYLLQCWDLACDPPRCVAELRHADGPYGGVVLNSDPDSPAVLALQSAQTESLSIDFDATDPECAFETEAVIDGMRELHLLSGSTLVTRRIDEGGPLCLWDLSDLERERVQLLNPSLAQPDDRVQAVHLAHDYALVVRVQCIELYATTPRPAILPVRGAPIAYPLAQFKIPWRTDTVVLCEQHTPGDAQTPGGPGPLHLFARFGSIYPWPVNVLHHYLLRPNPAYRAGPHGSECRSPGSGSTPTPASPSSPTPSSSSSCSSSSSSSLSSLSATTTEYNLPYDLRPSLVLNISSPVRLFGQSAMAIGRYGTALWLDNHSPEWWGGPSELGQRLVGRVLRHRVPRRRGRGSDGNGSVERPGCGAGKLATGEAEPEPEPEPESAAPTTAAMGDALMVFGVRDDDVWTRIALDEEAGRIALGHTDGAITLLEY